MTPLYWAILVAFGIVVVGIIFGIGGLLLFPIVGVIATVAVVVWLLQRRARDRPPIE